MMSIGITKMVLKIMVLGAALPMLTLSFQSPSTASWAPAVQHKHGMEIAFADHRRVGWIRPASRTQGNVGSITSLGSTASPRSHFTASMKGDVQPAQATQVMPTEKIAADDAKNDKETKYDLPWSQIQEWALRDQLPKYTMILALKNANGEEVAASYALWRSLTTDVAELAGYPVDFLQRVHDDLIARNATILQSTPKQLPYMDSYTFSSSGGVSGNVFDVPGIADGAKIETSKVDNIQLTLPKGYIRTADGSAAYELGITVQTTPEATDGVVNGAAAAGGAMLNSVANAATTASASSSSLSSGIGNAVGNQLTDDQFLVRMGTTAGIALTAATAMNMLSHHLTVNVFWV
eukprot:CAMPEP_0198122440 /NCGR_PEP_ID=MMETSP1442-20131203/34839_1 /TAXON_ID= /ORGANISM="Craspedostauros australis, Strain CCMP3328" /LENGTH=349 /DNA_ID=CAMNT_0043781459 /DNA_START=107 /DNA_END=1156 /DNA_ORIENTATION=+